MSECSLLFHTTCTQCRALQVLSVQAQPCPATVSSSLQPSAGSWHTGLTQNHKSNQPMPYAKQWIP